MIQDYVVIEEILVLFWHISSINILNNSTGNIKKLLVFFSYIVHYPEILITLFYFRYTRLHLNKLSAVAPIVKCINLLQARFVHKE